MANLMIVDDHPIFLDGLRQFLDLNGHKVIHCARSVVEAITLLATQRPDVLILDVSMKDGGGLRILTDIRAQGNNVPVIFLTVSIAPGQTLEAIKLGVNGIALKESDPADLLACIDSVIRNETHISPAVMEEALRFKSGDDMPKVSAFDTLTDREMEIAGLIRRGMRNRAIADLCGVSEGTVKVHLHSIFQKLGVKSRAELMVAMMPLDAL